MEDNFSKILSQTVSCKSQGCGRLGHRTIQLADEILVVGGTNNSSEYSTTILKFNLQNHRLDELAIENNLNIEGFSLFYHRSSLFLWGGNIQTQASNSLWLFDGIKFKLSTQNGTIPPPRAFHASVFFANRYLLIFGGFNKDQIFNDWFIFDAVLKEWKKIIPSSPVPFSASSYLGWVHGRGFLITCETVIKTQNKVSVEFTTNVYELRILDSKFSSIRLDRLDGFETTPPPRSQPSFAFKDNSIFLMGGERLAHDLQSMFDDVWAFNIETLTWKKLDITLTPKFGFEVVSYQNKLILIGGLINGCLLNTNVEVLSFLHQNQLNEKKICQLCESIYIPTPQPTPDQLQYQYYKVNPKLRISISFVSKLAQMIKNPLHALGLLVDNSFNMHSTAVSINLKIKKRDPRYFKGDIKYLQIADNSRIPNIFEDFYIFDHKIEKDEWRLEEQNTQKSQYCLNLKLASLRLGRSCLFVTQTPEKEKHLIYFSNSAIQSPEGEKPFNCYHCKITGKDDKGLERQIIRNNVGGVVQEEQYLDSSIYSTKVYILETYDVEKQKLEERHDIIYQGGLNEIEYSLRNYLSKLYCPPFIGREVQLEGSKVNVINLMEKFRVDEAHQWLQIVECSENQVFFKNINLYKIIIDNYQFDSVYIYHQNRFITTINSHERQICGLIEIADEVDVNLFKTQIERNIYCSQLRYFIQEIERKRNHSITGRIAIDPSKKKKQLNN